MAIKAYRPTTPAQRQKTTQDFDQITTRKPLKSLIKSKKQNAGKNNSGRITVRHRGGGVKRQYRILSHNLPTGRGARMLRARHSRRSLPSLTPAPPTVSCVPASRELVSGGPLPLPLSGGGQATREGLPPPQNRCCCACVLLYARVVWS